MTTEHQASRTLVKSPPELWAECSDAGSLARHIGEFGAIRITRLEPESAVQWEGEHAIGTVTIEPSGWGTRVTLTVQTAVDEEAERAQAPATADVTQPDAVSAREPEAVEIRAEEPKNESEEADEKVEETSAEPDTAVETDPAPVRGRWKRLIAQARTWFGAQADGSMEGPAEAAVAEAPPEATMAETPVQAPVVAPALDERAIEPEPGTEPETEPAAEVVEPFDPDAVLIAALDSLGQAHHRPFSRA